MYIFEFSILTYNAKQYGLHSNVHGYIALLATGQAESLCDQSGKNLLKNYVQLIIGG